MSVNCLIARKSADVDLLTSCVTTSSLGDPGAAARSP
jgi:hypothetical protein